MSGEHTNSSSSDAKHRSPSIEKQRESSLTADTQTAKSSEKLAQGSLDVLRETGTATTLVSAAIVEKGEDDDDFPDGGMRAWLVVLGVSRNDVLEF